MGCSKPGGSRASCRKISTTDELKRPRQTQSLFEILVASFRPAGRAGDPFAVGRKTTFPSSTIVSIR